MYVKCYKYFQQPSFNTKESIGFCMRLNQNGLTIDLGFLESFSFLGNLNIKETHCCHIQAELNISYFHKIGKN